MSWPLPDPDAPKGDGRNPFHQSDFKPLVADVSKYRPPGGGVYAVTPLGSAFHRERSVTTNGVLPRRTMAEYFADELAKCPKVDWEGHTEPELVRLAERWVAAVEGYFSPRSTHGSLAEFSFRFQMPDTGHWYEGTLDLMSLEFESQRLRGVCLWDYKTGAEQPDFRTSPQHHVYSLGIRYGVVAEVPYMEGHRLLDWSKMSPVGSFIPKRWPKFFRYLHLPALIARNAAWSIKALATDSEEMNLADSTAYIQSLTNRYLDKQPTRLSVAITTEPPTQTEAMSNPQAMIVAPTQPPKYELTAAEVVAQGQKIQEVMRAAMKPDEDYGVIPGTSRKDKDGNEKTKPTLLKPGAEKLLLLFRLAPTFEVEKTCDGEHREIFVRCKLTHIISGDFVGEGVGECSTRESKYAWRQADRRCPKCEQPAIFKSKKDGGWFCWDKKGGCGTQFRAGDQAIESQEIGRKPNPDLADTYNTVTKMACKRALVMAVLNTTGASFLFTQDLEDFVGNAETTADYEQPAPTQSTIQPQLQYTFGVPRGAGYATDAQLNRIKANCDALGFNTRKVLVTAVNLGAPKEIVSVADVSEKVATQLVLKLDALLKATDTPRPEREKTPEEIMDEHVRQIVGELRTKRAKELAEIIRSGPLGVESIIDIMANEAAPDTQFSALAEAQQEQVLHTIKNAAQAAADRIATK